MADYKSNPKITILLATFNRAHLILETLDSIKDQTYANFECLITDDNSTDNTKEVVTRFCKNDTRFSYHKKPSIYPQGLSANRNFGLDLADELEAQFIQFFDDDDIMHPQKLELQIRPLIENSELDLTICMYRKFWDKNSIEFDIAKAFNIAYTIDTDNLLKSFYLNKINLNSIGPVWRIEILKKYRFDEDLYYAEEREFYLRIFLLESLRFETVNKVLCWYRKHDKAITSNFYKNSKIKILSEQLYSDKFRNLVLSHDKPPFFLLKSYTRIALKQQNFELLKTIDRFFDNFKSFSSLEYFVLSLSIKLYLSINYIKTIKDLESRS